MSAHPIASLSDLPQEVLNLLGRFDKPRAGIADIGESFNASDVIYPDSPPQQRLVSGVAGKDCVELKVEFGGIAYHTEQIEFRDTWRGWTRTRGGYGPVVLKPAPVQPPRP